MGISSFCRIKPASRPDVQICRQGIHFPDRNFTFFLLNATVTRSLIHQNIRRNSKSLFLVWMLLLEACISANPKLPEEYHV